MRYSLLVLSTLAFTVGCRDVSVGPVPSPPGPVKALRLESGSYNLLVTDVNELDCEGARPEDFFGMSLPLEVRFAGRGIASGFLADLYVEGAQTAGVLRLDAVGPVVYEEEGETEPESPPDERDEEGEDSTDADEGEDRETREDREDPDGDDCADDREDCDDEVVVEPEPMDFSLAVELRATRRDHAVGALYYELEGCSLQLEVVAQKVERGGGDEPVPAEESGCDDEESDCG